MTMEAGGMDLPVNPPVAPMLAKPVGAIPGGDYVFEPKWDGFRSIVFRDGDEVEIGSRNERPMTRYFPELVAAVRAELPERCVIDGEIVVPDAEGRRLDFEALQLRIHPAASRVELLSTQTPGHFIAFDLLALGDSDYMERPFAERRAALEDVLATVGSPIHLTPTTTDREVAAGWFSQFEGAGLDGLIAKPTDGIYEPDKRVMKKVKHERTADCVVAGYRVHKSGEDRIGSLLLGLYKDDGKLASVGVIGAFPMERRKELFIELQPLVTTFEAHPWNWAQHQAGERTPRAAMASRWNADKDLSFIPLRPERVVEVRYDHMEGPRFRHTAQFVRWRPDREPRSCTYAQLEEPVSFDLAEILRGRPVGEPAWLSRRWCWSWRATRSRSATRARCSSRGPGSPSWTWCATTWPWRRGRWAACGGRPMALKRFVNGAESEPFFQKRAPEKRPDWIGTVELRFPSGRTADEVVVTDEAALAWVINLGCIDLNPHPVRTDDLDHPDELRVDLDPVPGVEWPQIRDVALVARDVLADFGLTGWPKTSGSRGMHIYARIQPRWEFGEVRRAAVAVAREIERRAPELATSKWWKEERHGVFVDYNQNAKDRTVASAYSIRPVPDARVSAPLTWAEVPSCDPAEYRIDTVPARFARIGDPWAEMDEAAGSLDGLLELAARDEAAGLPDAPWPPHYDKQSGEAPRVQPSKRRGSSSGGASPGGGRLGVRPTAEHHAADRDRARGEQGRGHGGPGTLEGKACRGLAEAGARRRPGRLDARAQLELVPDPAQPAARPRSRTPAARTPGSRLRPLEGVPAQPTQS